MPCKASLCTRSALATALAADLSGRAHAKRAQGQRGEAQGVRHTARTVARVYSTMLPHSLRTRRVPCDSQSIGAGTCYDHAYRSLSCMLDGTCLLHVACWMARACCMLHVGWHVHVACCMLDGTCMLHVACCMARACCTLQGTCLLLVSCLLLLAACCMHVHVACCMLHDTCMLHGTCMLHVASGTACSWPSTCASVCSRTLKATSTGLRGWYVTSTITALYSSAFVVPRRCDVIHSDSMP